MNKEPKERKVEYLGICKILYEKPKKLNEKQIQLKQNIQKFFKKPNVEDDAKLKLKMEIIEKQNQILKEKKELKNKEHQRTFSDVIQSIQEEFIIDECDDSPMSSRGSSLEQKDELSIEEIEKLKSITPTVQISHHLEKDDQLDLLPISEEISTSSSQSLDVDEFSDISMYQESESAIPSDFNINESEFNDLTINDFDDDDDMYDELDDPFIFEEITGTSTVDMLQRGSFTFSQESANKKKKLLIDIKKIVKNDKSISNKEKWEKVIDLRMKEKLAGLGNVKSEKFSEMKTKYEQMKEKFANRMVEKQMKIEEFKKKMELEVGKFDETKGKIIEKIELEKEKFEIETDKLRERFEIKREKMGKKKEEFLGNVANTFDVYSLTTISYDELKAKGMNDQVFLECFGLFPKFRDIVKQVEDTVELFDKTNINFVFGYPSIDGALTSYSSNHKRYALVESTFISFYQGSKAKENLKNRTPSRVLSLQECQVTRRIDLDTLDRFVFEIEVSKPYYSRKLYLSNKDEIEQWIWVLRRNSAQIGFRYNSSFPVQKNNGCNFFIGGKSYFEELSECMKKAKNEIFICGWVLSPHFYLNRNPNKDRFDDLLVEIAEKGVKIYILIWDENNWVIDLGTAYAKQIVSKLHKNITIFKDPAGTMFQFWSHHQKCVIIDQEVGFCGGIDIAYNRWEDPEKYSIFDENEVYFPGMDYVNPLIKTVYVGENLTSYLDRSKKPRLPWQDIQCKVVGYGGRDLAKNFIQRWNFSVRKTTLPQLILSKDPFSNISKDEPYPKCDVQILRSACKWSFGIEMPERSIYDAYIELIENSKHFIYIENQFFISASSETQKNPRNYIVGALIKRIRTAIEKKKNFKVIVCLPFQTG
jgi:phosphatidylserine/phosphatidylglycerophosphate/cardiolipin synthase-like enzyme